MTMRRIVALFRPLALLMAVSRSCLGTKHQYKTRHDERTLIGPLGYPFGFLKDGYYNLTVFGFGMEIGDHTQEGQNTQTDFYEGDGLRRRRTESVLEGIIGVGFLLKRFKDESEFNAYMNNLRSDPDRCAFEIFVDGSDDPFGGEEDDAYKDVGQELSAGEHGVFLNMMNENKTLKEKASVAYTFGAEEAGLYFLIYQICPPTDRDIHSHFELDFHFVNIDMLGNESHLSSGDMFLPHMYFYFTLFYIICVYLWVTNIKRIKQGLPGHFANPSGGTPIVYPIHYIMSALLILKLLSVFFESVRYHYLRVSGKAELWTGVYYMFSFMKGTLLFTVILLIGSGWSFVKPFLTDREKQMIFAVLVLQVINNIAILVLNEETEGEKAFDRWTATLHMVDILCCCAVLMPIVWQVNALEKNSEQSNGDHDDSEENDDDDDHVPEDEFENVALNSSRTSAARENSRLASKLRLFRSFYLLVVCYVYMTRIVVYLFESLLTYRYIWVKEFIVEAVTLAFYCQVGMMFRPMCENPYLHVTSDENGERGRSRRAEVELT